MRSYALHAQGHSSTRALKIGAPLAIGGRGQRALCVCVGVCVCVCVCVSVAQSGAPASCLASS